MHCPGGYEAAIELSSRVSGCSYRWCFPAAAAHGDMCRASIYAPRNWDGCSVDSARGFICSFATPLYPPPSPPPVLGWCLTSVVLDAWASVPLSKLRFVRFNFFLSTISFLYLLSLKIAVLLWYEVGGSPWVEMEKSIEKDQMLYIYVNLK